MLEQVRQERGEQRGGHSVERSRVGGGIAAGFLNEACVQPRRPGAQSCRNARRVAARIPRLHAK